MEVITFDSKIYQEIKKKIDFIFETLSVKQETEKVPVADEKDMWVDTEEVCKYLKISKRTLQRLKTAGKIPYSVLSGKSFYSIADIKNALLLNKMYTTEERINALKASYSARYQALKGNSKPSILNSGKHEH